MKLLHIIGELDIKNGGTYTALSAIVQLLDKLGHENFIIATGNGTSEYDTGIYDGRLLFFDKSFPARFRNSRDAYGWMNKNLGNFDIVIVHEIWGGIGLAACWVAKLKKIDYFIWPHGSLDPFDLKKKKGVKKVLGKFIVHQLLWDAKCIICTSVKEKELLNCFGKKNNNIIVLPLPVDFCVEPISEKVQPGLISPVIKNDAFVYLFFSRINYKKGLDLFLKAFSACLKDGSITKNAFLVVAGTGSDAYEEYIKALVIQLNLQEHIVFLGMITGEQRLLVYQNAHVFVLPSKNENFGLAVIESLQAGTPILISRNIYIYEELFNNCSPGWLCEYDMDDLKAKIIESSFVNTAKRIDAKKAGTIFVTDNLLKEYSNYF